MFFATPDVQGCKKMLLDGEADLVVAQPIPRGVWGHTSPAKFFYVYALKSILVHSETNILVSLRAN